MLSVLLQHAKYFPFTQETRSQGEGLYSSFLPNMLVFYMQGTVLHGGVSIQSYKPHTCILRWYILELGFITPTTAWKS